MTSVSGNLEEADHPPGYDDFMKNLADLHAERGQVNHNIRSVNYLHLSDAVLVTGPFLIPKQKSMANISIYFSYGRS